MATVTPDMIENLDIFDHSLKCPFPVSVAPPVYFFTDCISMDTKYNTDGTVATAAAAATATIEMTATKEKEKVKENQYEEWHVCMTAADKYGMSFLNGALLALYDLKILQNTKFIHSIGMANLITGELISGLATSTPHSDQKNRELEPSHWFDFTNPDGHALRSERVFVNDVIVPITDWITSNQERIIAPRWYCCCCCKSSTDAHIQWLKEMKGFDRLSQHMDFVHVKPFMDKDTGIRMKDSPVPIFTMNAQVTHPRHHTIAMTTYSQPPATDMEVPGIPRFERMHQQTTESIYEFMIQSCIEDEECFIRPGYTCDPFAIQSARSYFHFGNRGPISPRLKGQNQRLIVIDAFDGSHASHNIHTLPYIETIMNADDRKELALSPGMFIPMYHSVIGGLDEFMNECRRTDPDLTAISSSVYKRMSNWGYMQVMRCCPSISTQQLKHVRLPHEDVDNLVPT